MVIIIALNLCGITQEMLVVHIQSQKQLWSEYKMQSRRKSAVKGCLCLPSMLKGKLSFKSQSMPK
jgi:hypothetical protein